MSTSLCLAESFCLQGLDVFYNYLKSKQSDKDIPLESLHFNSFDLCKAFDSTAFDSTFKGRHRRFYIYRTFMVLEIVESDFRFVCLRQEL